MFPSFSGEAVLFLLSSICILTQATSLVYNELETLGVSCYPRDSCYISYREPEERDEKETTCECVDTCYRRGTCCIDSPFVDPRPSTRNEVCYGERIIGVAHYYYFKNTGYYSIFQVTKCDRRWRGPLQLKKLCEMEEPVEGVDLMVALPVTNIYNGVSYKNYFCAICNNDIAGSVLWDVAIYKEGSGDLISDRFTVQATDDAPAETTGANGTCNGRDALALVYNEEVRYYGYWDNCSSDTPRFVWVTVTMAIPEEIQPYVKSCIPNLVSQCAPGWRDTRIRLKCGAYMGLIKSPQSTEVGRYDYKYFRNVHCAICNNVTDFAGYTCEPLSGGDIITTPTYPTSLTVLFGHLLSNKGCLGDDERYVDGLGCRAVVCANPSHKVKNGKCEPP